MLASKSKSYTGTNKPFCCFSHFTIDFYRERGGEELINWRLGAKDLEVIFFFGFKHSHLQTMQERHTFA